MLREEALSRIKQDLENKRRGLNSDLTGKLGGWADRGDSADAAFASGSDEIQSQLAQIESGEMVLIERALVRIRKGTYGVCESCQKQIPTGRLNALPYSVHCIKCQEEIEEDGAGSENSYLNWSRVNEGLKSFDEPAPVDISRLAMDLG